VLTVIEPPNDPWDKAVMNLLRARLLAREGRHGESERLARAAVEYWESTDADPSRADAHRALGEVLRHGGKAAEARAALERALELEERLGATLLLERTRALIAELG
jgi:tetratricopeptide (TPR) repeat protein